jgi:hypothetical protein
MTMSSLFVTAKQLEKDRERKESDKDRINKDRK